MAQNPDSLAFRFALVLGLAVFVLAVTSWVVPPNLANDTAAPHSESIYRAQHLSLF
jgi:hypothetical protein